MAIGGGSVSALGFVLIPTMLWDDAEGALWLS